MPWAAGFRYGPSGLLNRRSIGARSVPQRVRASVPPVGQPPVAQRRLGSRRLSAVLSLSKGRAPLRGARIETQAPVARATLKCLRPLGFDTALRAYSTGARPVLDRRLSPARDASYAPSAQEPVGFHTRRVSTLRVCLDASLALASRSGTPAQRSRTPPHTRA